MRWNLIALAAASALLALLGDAPAAAGDPAATPGDRLTFSSAPVRIARIQVKAGVSFDDAVESMRLRANQRNLKYVGLNQLGKEIEALGGKPSRRIEIFSFCDALTAQKMIEADASMLAYMPCRVGMLEDGQGNVDPVRFPNFAAFAQHASWYRDATTISESTTYSIPAMLDGRQSRSSGMNSIRGGGP